MAVIVPAVMAFAAAGGTVAGVAAALTGAAGFATFATVAGGMLSTIGGLTKSKTLSKIGGIMSLVGGVASLANAASGAASGAAEAAGSELATAAGEAAAESAAASGSLIPDGSLGATADTLGSLGATGGSLAPAADAAAGAAANATGASNAMDLESFSFMDQARLAKTPIEAVGGSAAGGTTQPQAAGSPGTGRLAQVATEIKDTGHLQSLLDKTGQGLNSLGTFVKNNKELVQIGGQLVQGGVQAHERQAEWDAQMNLIEQRRRRLNSPIALRYAPQATGGQAGAPMQLGPIGG